MYNIPKVLSSEACKVHNCKAVLIHYGASLSQCHCPKEREVGHNLCTTHGIHGHAAVPTLRQLHRWTFPITAEPQGQGAGVDPQLIPRIRWSSQEPPWDPLLPRGFSGTPLLATGGAGSRATVNNTVPPLCRRGGALGGPMRE